MNQDFRYLLKFALLIGLGSIVSFLSVALIDWGKTADRFSSIQSTISEGFWKGSIGRLFIREDPLIGRCEEIAQRIIKSPATYRRANAAVFREVAVLEFDSQNGFGALLRSQVVCGFNNRSELELVKFNGENVAKELTGAKF